MGKKNKYTPTLQTIPEEGELVIPEEAAKRKMQSEKDKAILAQSKEIASTVPPDKVDEMLDIIKKIRELRASKKTNPESLIEAENLEKRLKENLIKFRKEKEEAEIIPSRRKISESERAFLMKSLKEVPPIKPDESKIEESLGKRDSKKVTFATFKEIQEFEKGDIVPARTVSTSKKPLKSILKNPQPLEESKTKPLEESKTKPLKKSILFNPYGDEKATNPNDLFKKIASLIPPAKQAEIRGLITKLCSEKATNPESEEAKALTEQLTGALTECNKAKADAKQLAVATKGILKTLKRVSTTTGENSLDYLIQDIQKATDGGKVTPQNLLQKIVSAFMKALESLNRYVSQSLLNIKGAAHGIKGYEDAGLSSFMKKKSK